MSLMRQIGWLLLATLAGAWAASVAVNVHALRETLQTQVRLRNSDGATALALVMSQQRGDAGLMAMVATAQFDQGYYSSIRLFDATGRKVFERVAPGLAQSSPAWFAALLPITSEPGVAQVSDGWRALGSVEVASQPGFAHDALWSASLRAALALAAVGGLAGLLAAVGVARLRRPLDEVVRQATLLQRGEYLTLAEPAVPELRRLTRTMNTMVERLRTMFEAQAVQVEALRRQATCDALTGVSNRTQFMALLGASLQREDGPAAGGLVLLRLLDLAQVNRTLGPDGTNRLLATIGQVLQAYTARVEGAFVGRLNGSDFGLALPQGGLALEAAQAVVDLLHSALPGFAHGVAVAAGAIETRHGAPLAEVLGRADLALARAEGAGPFGVDTGFDVAPAEADAAPSDWADLGERGWTARVRAALGDDRIELDLGGAMQLASFPLVDASGRLIHLECPLRLRLSADGPFEVAARWLPLALRGRLTGTADERALALALQAITADGQPRGVNFSPASLDDGGFVARVRAQLLAAPRAARSLWIEVAESAAIDRFELLHELARQLRSTGARLGLEHAGERLTRIDRLFEAGLDYVKLDAALSDGLGADEAKARFVRGLVTMLHSLPVQVFAEGVADDAAAQALWRCGVDGITGPFVTAPTGDRLTAGIGPT
jgi:EAL domain-containing protein (putative c-di-GMP-specific phosphodiesterase class I)/GGDEF domain-containing protein